MNKFATYFGCVAYVFAEFEFVVNYNVCMCVYVCMYVCMYVCIYICMYVRVYVCVCMYV